MPAGPKRPVPTLLLVAVASLAAMASASIAWDSQGTLSAHGQDPPIVFEAGDNADNPRWFKSFEITSDNTSFSAEIKPRAGAGTHVEDVVRLHNPSGQERHVTVTGSSVDNDNVETFHWTITDDADETVATLDHKDADPSTDLTLPASETYTFAVTVETKIGAGSINAGIAFSVGLEVT